MNEIELSNHYGFPEKIANFHGMHLHSVTSDWGPYVFKVQERTKSGDVTWKWNGFVIDYVNEASKLMNFTWSIDYSDNWGNSPPYAVNHTSKLGNLYIHNLKLVDIIFKKNV